MSDQDYRLEKHLNESDRSVLFRGRAGDGTLAIVKALLGEPPAAREIEVLRHEYQVAAAMEIDGVLKPTQFGRVGGGLAVVYEDFDGLPLRSLLKPGGMGVEDVLHLTSKAAFVLAEIHRQRIIHKNVNPDSLLVQIDRGAVRLIDFSLSSELRREQPTAAAVSALEGDLRYVSPEQTGRMNRAIDHRADLYSLGVTLYEMLTGHVPFDAPDALGLVHAHIAREPLEPRAVRAGVPQVVSSVVMKLLSKRSEDRYQSAAGLEFDISRIIDSFETGGDFPEFTLGQADRAEQLSIPEKLLGREAELDALLAAFDRAAGGLATFVLVAGYSGVGKSALIREVHRPIVARRGEFVSGKFDQFRREIPYSALTQALAEMIKRILAEPKERVAEWRERVRNALGESGGVLSGFLPELELLVGPQESAAPLPPVEAEARFRVVFERFIHAIATADHPVALFLDDLQWADLATLDLINRLVREEADRHLLIIGAYRDNEVDEDHPVMLTIDTLRRGGTPPIEISLGPLTEPEVAELVAATVQDTAGRSKGLAELVHEKTGGNPFFIQQFLTALYEEEHLSYDADHDRWRWDLRGIRTAAITSNVVDLMAKKIDALPESASEMLRLASCLGNEFDVESLATIASSDRVGAAADLWPAVAEGLVLPMGEGYRFLRAARGSTGTDGDHSQAAADLGLLNAGYRFLHDRVHQAAYESIPDADLPALHLRIGRLLRTRFEASGDDDGLFEVANHLNAGMDELDRISPDGRAECLEIARLNNAAGQRARASSAWAPAAAYFGAGRRMLEADAWSKQYPLALELHRYGAEAEYMGHGVETGEALVGTILENVRDPLDGIPAYGLRIHHAVLQALIPEALSIAIEALGGLGVQFPARPTQLHVLREVGRIKLMLLRRSHASLRNAPVMTDARQLASLRLVIQTAPAAYQCDPNMLALLICKQVELVLRHGNCPDAGQAIASWAVLIGGALGDLDGLYDYGKLGAEMSAMFDDHGARGRAQFHFDIFARHWRDPLADTADALAESGRLCAEGGDLQFYAYCLYHAAYAALFSGTDLAEMSERLHRCQVSLRRVDAEHAIPMGGAGLQFVTCLRGEAKDPSLLTGDHFDADSMIPELERIGHKSAMAFAMVLQAMLAYQFRRFDRAVAFIETALPFRDMIMALPIEAEMFYFEGLARTALARDSTGSTKRAHLRVAKGSLSKLKKFARKAPMNYAHKRDLVLAEYLDAKGRGARAHDIYERAVIGARASGFVHDEALAAERAFDAFRRQDRSILASAYLRTSITAYASWGAQAKVDDLVESHPGQDTGRAARSSGSEGAVDANVSLDVGTVVKASQVISREIIFDRLLSKLMGIVIQNAGAQRGVLLRIDPEGPVVEARGAEKYVELGGVLEPLEDACASRSVIDYVVRTRDAVVVDDAQIDPRFRDDPYVVQRGLRSVLAVPTLAQDRVTGVLYVENDLSAGTFSGERVELLRMISSQAAISLSNARLYTDIADLNRSYERFVPRPFLGLLERSSITDVHLGDHVERELTILFADIRGFTALSESMGTEETFDLINEYLGLMEPLIRRRGGVIDKYVGDAIMALFEGDADQAVRTALDMLEALAGLNAERAKAGKPAVQIGIGVNTGRCMIGTIGGHDRMDGTVVGDAVNVAARLETWTKHAGASLLVSEPTRDAMSHADAFEMRRLGSVAIEGRGAPVIVHEVLDALPQENRATRLATRELFDRGLAALDRGEREASTELFDQVLSLDPEDKAAQRLLGLARE